MLVKKKMKNSIVITLIVGMVMSLFMVMPNSVNAEAESYIIENGIKYKKVAELYPKQIYYGVEGFASEAAKNEHRGILTIPDKVQGYYVRDIMEGAFKDCSNITGIELPSNLSIIDDNAFAWCTGLTDDITIHGFPVLGRNAFAGVPAKNYVITSGFARLDMYNNTFGDIKSDINVYVRDSLISNGYLHYNYELLFKGMSDKIHVKAIEPKINGENISTDLIELDKGYANEVQKEYIPEKGYYGELNIKTDNNSAKASFDSTDNVLTIPTGLPVGTYGIDIVATDKEDYNAVCKVTIKINGPEDEKNNPEKADNSDEYDKVKPDNSDKDDKVKADNIDKNDKVKSEDKITPIISQNEKMNVKFKNGGKAVKSKKILKNKKIGKLPKASKKNKAFKGWYTKKNGGKKVTPAYKVKKNQTLYAKWHKVGKVKSPGITLRTSKSKYSKMKAEITPNTKIVILSSKDKFWYKVKVGKRTGYVYKPYVEVLK